jgi:hypothetical protein
MLAKHPSPRLLCSPLGSIVDSLHPFTFRAYRYFDQRCPRPLHD